MISTEPPAKPHAFEKERRYSFFPGWVMVAMAGAAQFFSAPGQSYSVATFKEAMRETLEVTETNYSLAYAFATVVSGVLLPAIGFLIDRSGARRMLPAIALLLGAGCLGMSYVHNTPTLYLGFSVVRSLGQGALSLVAAWLVGEWFARRRGFATALSGLGGSLSVMSIPLINRYVIENYSWQQAWIVLGLAVWAFLLLPSLFLVRDCPEDLGLLPDGDIPSGQPTTREERRAKRTSSDGDWQIDRVLFDLTFWKLLAVPATSGMVGTGLVFHCVTLLGSRGVPPGWAVAVISCQAAISTCAALVAGWLSDRLPARFLLAAAMIFLGIGTTTVLLMNNVYLTILYAAVLGLHGSVIRSTGMVVWMDYYGRENQGAIRGFAMAAMILAAAVGPLPLAVSLDYFGSYNYALYLFIGVPAFSAILVSTAGPPRARPAPPPSS